MGFNVKAAREAAGLIVDTGGAIAEKTVGTINTVKDGKLARQIKMSTHKSDTVIRCIDAGEQALKTASSIYATISQSINATKEVNSKIQEAREKFELEKQKLDREFEDMKLKYQLEEKKSSESHAENMERIRAFHEEEMRKIDTVRETVLGLMNLLNNLALNYPEQMYPYVQQVSSCLTSIKMNSYNLLED